MMSVISITFLLALSGDDPAGASPEPWLPDELIQWSQWYERQAGDPQSEIVVEAIIWSRFQMAIIESALEQGRPERDAIAAAAQGDMRLTSWHSNRAQAYPGLTCSEELYRLDLETRPGGSDHIAYNSPDRARIVHAWHSYFQRFNVAMIADADHPLHDACRATLAGEPDQLDRRWQEAEAPARQADLAETGRLLAGER